MKQGNRDNAVFFIKALSAAVSVLLFLSKTNGKVESHTKSRAFSANKRSLLESLD